MKMMQTRDLNLAAFLLSMGFFLKTMRKIGMNDCIWFFDNVKDIGKHAEHFNLGRAEVNLTNFLYHRTVLKTYSAKTGITREEVPFKDGLRAGDSYFYIEANKVWHAVYAEKSPHIERQKSGGVFPDLKAANEVLKLKTSDN